MTKMKKIRNKKLHFQTYDDFDAYCQGKDIQRCIIQIDEYLTDLEFSKRYKSLSVNTRTGEVINNLPNGSLVK